MSEEGPVGHVGTPPSVVRVSTTLVRRGCRPSGTRRCAPVDNRQLELFVRTPESRKPRQLNPLGEPEA